MDDLSARISQLLQDPQSLQLLQSVAQNLGLGQTAPPPVPPPPPQPAQAPAPNAGGLDPKQLGALLSQLGLGNNANNITNNASSGPPAALPGGLNLGLLQQVQGAMSSFAQGNQGVQLLQALRPLLSARRQGRVDDAIRLMQLLQMLPLLSQAGLFGLGGEGR